MSPALEPVAPATSPARRPWLRGVLILGRLLGVLALALAGYRWLYVPEPSPPAPAEEAEAAPQAFPRFEGADLAGLTPAQRAVATWLGNKYRVAPEAVAYLLLEAERLAPLYKLDVNLIMAVAAIESNFHPLIESPVGAQGLMQVMPQIHAYRYEAYQQKNAALDPVVNLQVGVSILRDAIKLRGGSEDAGLIFYFGGDGAAGQRYLAKVRAEQARLRRVAAGEDVPIR